MKEFKDDDVFVRS